MLQNAVLEGYPGQSPLANIAEHALTYFEGKKLHSVAVTPLWVLRPEAEADRVACREFLLNFSTMSIPVFFRSHSGVLRLKSRVFDELNTYEANGFRLHLPIIVRSEVQVAYLKSCTQQIDWSPAPKPSRDDGHGSNNLPNKPRKNAPHSRFGALCIAKWLLFPLCLGGAAGCIYELSRQVSAWWEYAGFGAAGAFCVGYSLIMVFQLAQQFHLLWQNSNNVGQGSDHLVAKPLLY